jgi:hypothetical protein
MMSDTWGMTISLRLRKTAAPGHAGRGRMREQWIV